MQNPPTIKSSNAYFIGVSSCELRRALRLTHGGRSGTPHPDPRLVSRAGSMSVVARPSAPGSRWASRRVGPALDVWLVRSGVSQVRVRGRGGRARRRRAELAPPAAYPQPAPATSTTPTGEPARATRYAQKSKRLPCRHMNVNMTSRISDDRPSQHPPTN